MASVVPASHDEDMIWWVFAAAVVVFVGLVYVMRHESELCAPARPDERLPADPPRGGAAAGVRQTRRAA
jgi:hypothetical protein